MNEYVLIIIGFVLIVIDSLIMKANKDVSNAIDSIGEDRIKKYYFGVDA